MSFSEPDKEDSDEENCDGENSDEEILPRILKTYQMNLIKNNFLLINAQNISLSWEFCTL